jgi:fibronectin type 3 domain-containing protein
MEEIITLLARIAKALEEENRLCAGFIETQTTWRDEAEALNQKRYEEVTARDQARLEMERRNVVINEGFLALQTGEQALRQAHYERLSLLSDGGQKDD